MIVKAQAVSKGIRLKAPKVAYGDRRFFKQIFSDEQRYIQILNNFLTNAIKFSYRGESIEIFIDLKETQSISSNASINDNKMFISFDLIIRDHGYGISEENQ